MKVQNWVRVLLQTGVILGLATSIPTAWSDDINGQALFEKRCSACHKLPNPDNPPPEGWSKRLDMMAPLAQLKSGQKDAVLDYLTNHVEKVAKNASLEDDKAFFEEKCSRCHSLERILLEPLTDDARRHVVSRMQAKSGTNWLTDKDVERVLNYLSRAKLKAPEPSKLAADAKPEEIFAARCQACHTLERVIDHLDAKDANQIDWSHVVSRMRNKAPQWMTAAEAKQIADYLQSLETTKNGG